MTCVSDTRTNTEEEVALKNNDNRTNHEDQDDFASVVSSSKDTKNVPTKVSPNRGRSVSNISYTICILYVNYTHGKFCDYFAATCER